MENHECTRYKTAASSRHSLFQRDSTKVPFEVLAFAYSALCQTTVAIAISTLSPFKTGDRLKELPQQLCRYCPRPRAVTLVILTEMENRIAALAKARGQLHQDSAYKSIFHDEFMRQSYAESFAELRNIPLSISGCHPKDIAKPTLDEAEFGGTY